MILPAFLIVYLAAVLGDSVGFYKFGYFVSVGYTLAVVCSSLTILLLYKSSLTLLTTLLIAIVITYSVRLGTFVFMREMKSSSYRNKVKGEFTDGSKMSLSGKVSMWLGCALIYACEVSPILFRLKNGTADNFMLFVGIVVSATGAVVEALADHQKSMAKKKDPNLFVDTGLFSIVRCPNYLGEVLVWTGVFLSGFTANSGFWQWLSAISGYVFITFVMFAAARNLEIRHNKTYGENEKYKEYAKKTPIIIPCVPLYSLEKYKYLAA